MVHILGLSSRNLIIGPNNRFQVILKNKGVVNYDRGAKNN